MEKFSHQTHIEGQIIPREILQREANLWRFQSKKIVFTNGCFDILHKGHIDYLCKAKDLGDLLVVGVNTDASVKRLEKGTERPINSELSRAYLVAALSVVDAVVLFDEDTPLNIIQLINPDVLVKGGDYTIKTIVGSDHVLKNGGKVEIIPLTEGFSTTKIVETLKQK